ncbi:MAG: ATP-grasp domain-containing protein [Deltaproteobacteria bacterium]|nr:ATP-grasp domain-containing protein [Deltaproteobacteria bacterium]
MGRVIVLYNTDYDDDPTAAVDATSVESSARSIQEALVAGGHTAELVGLQGHEVFDVLSRLRSSAPDLVFNLCESMAGDARNEPTMAGLLDLFALRYTGADLPALAACLHKRRSKDILLGRGIPTPPHRFLSKASDLDDAVLDSLDYPWFLKLAHEDASIGITEANLVHDAAALRTRARAMIAEYEQPVLAERYIDGREINVTLIGNGTDLAMLPLHEIDFGAMPPGRPRIVSYAAKWDEAHVDYAGTKSVPLRDASAGLIAVCERVARAAWDAHGLRDYARVDLRVDNAGRPWVIDVNPNPDISPDAGVVRAAAVAGMTYVQLVQKIAAAAMKRPARV